MKLTKAQIGALEVAARSGGIVGFGRKAQTVMILRRHGLLSVNRDNYGYFTITPAGRSLLNKEAQKNE